MCRKTPKNNSFRSLKTSIRFLLIKIEDKFLPEFVGLNGPGGSSKVIILPWVSSMGVSYPGYRGGVPSIMAYICGGTIAM